MSSPRINREKEFKFKAALKEITVLNQLNEDSSTLKPSPRNSLKVLLLLRLRLSNVVVLEDLLLDHTLLHQVLKKLPTVIPIFGFIPNIIQLLLHSICFGQPLVDECLTRNFFVTFLLNLSLGFSAASALPQKVVRNSSAICRKQVSKNESDRKESREE